MFKENETVVYGRSGVCVIDSIESKSYSLKNSSEHKCYVLKPVFDKSSTIFVPVDNEKLTSAMRHVLTKKEIDEMLKSVKKSDAPWIDDRRERNEKFKEILSHGVCRELLLVIKCLTQRKRELSESGKKLCASDDVILKDAHAEVSHEFGYALGLDKNETEDYIVSHLH